MEKMTRRAALTWFSASGLAAGLAAIGQRAHAEEHASGATELFVVGPFPLGDWFQRSTAKGLPDEFAIGQAPDIKVVIAALNASPLFLIGTRDVTNPKTPIFPEKSHDPLLAIAGTPMWTWAQKDTSCTIRVEKMDVACDTTRNGESPPWQRVLASVALQLTGAISLVRLNSMFNLVERITYEVSGKLLSCERP